MNNAMRYRRHVLLPEIGAEGQKKLAESSVLVVGAGGLGAPVLQYLVAAGIGRIAIMDPDTVSETNLNRQILYGEQDLGKQKAGIATERLKQLNSEIELIPIHEPLTAENADSRVQGYSALALCTDNLKARLNANRACVKNNIPYVDGAVGHWSGTIITILPGETPCYECIHGHTAQTDETIPILGAMAGWTGSAQALAVIRLLLGTDDPSRGTIIFLNGKEVTTELIPIARNPNCPVCGSIKER
jgi:adenylyltransferase/sulfurtransferase